MLKKLTALLLMLLLPGAALAEVYEGVTAALSSVIVTAESAGTVQALEAPAGAHVREGDALVLLRAERAYATQDGIVSLLHTHEGDKVSGEVLELMPLERYLIYCTVEKAYQSAPSTLIHSGERLYIRCTTDGTHRAIGLVTQIDGAEYRVLTLGGELYVGETVNLYRDEDFTTALRVGVGTVVSNDTQTYEAEGRLTRLCVEAGDKVERGQLLYEINGSTAFAPTSGILASVSVSPGDAVEEGQTLAQIVPEDQIVVEIHVPETEASRIAAGRRATLFPADCEDEEGFGGTVIRVSHTPEDGLFTVRIRPDEGRALPLGLSVSVRIEEE